MKISPVGLRKIGRMFWAAMLLSGCATPPRVAQKHIPNPAVYSSFKEKLPKEFMIHWGPPINYSQPSSITHPRFKQIQSVVMQDMQTKGYSTFTMTSPDCPLYTTATISIDYSTRPAIFADGKWDHSVSISFTHYPRHLGNTEAIWRGFASESIDSILMTLSLEAMGKVPRYSE